MAAEKKRGLVEGFVREAGQRVRQYFAREPSQNLDSMVRGGVPGIERAGMPLTLTSQFGYDQLGQHLRIDQDLHSRYVDAESMDDTAEITAALDIYADDATTQSLEEERAIWATSPNNVVQKDLNEMLRKRVQVEDDVWGVARTLAKYGNVFGENLVTERGVVGLRYLPPPTIRRIEDPYGTLLGFIQDIRGDFNVSLEDFYKLAEQRDQAAIRGRSPGEMTVFEDWELVHWRLRGKHLRSIYGHGVIDGARHVFKRLAMLEDALFIYKLERAPQRFAFYVDVGQMDAERGLAYLNRVKSQYTRKKYVNPGTGAIDMRYNPLSMDEDFWVPVRNGKRSTEIDVLQGPDYSETQTLEYWRDKLVAALKIPKVYMGQGGEATRGALASEDIRFARTVIRLQQVLRGGYRKVCRVHLIAQGMNPDAVDYDVRMNVPNQIMELAKIEVLSATADLAGRMADRLPERLLLTRIFKFTDEEAVAIMKERDEDKVRNAKMERRVAELSAPPGQEPAASDNQEAMTEARLTKLFTAVHRDWRRDFDGDRRRDRELGDKLERLLRSDRHAANRVLRLEGLLGDIRSAMRQAPIA